MLAAAIIIALTAISLAMLLNLWRLLCGPDLPDRVLALDTLYINTIALLVLLGIHFDSLVYFEVSLLIAIVGFIGTVVFSKYVLRGDVIE
ncbi:MAG: K+/H+ antiporter subunit F [Gammaproteobacteria bacterium]|nr:K+/H+ antiporter subunit F [Gammaproteobacteria bacterium]